MNSTSLDNSCAKQNIRHRRREQKLCADCGVSSIKYRCESCQERFRKYYCTVDKERKVLLDKARRQKRRDNNLCYDCGAKLTTGRRRCLSCTKLGLESKKASTQRLNNEREIAGVCNKCGQHKVILGLKYCEQCRLKISKWGKFSREKLVKSVLTHYSNGTPKCFCCGEQEFAFLSIDHINGREPGELRGGGYAVYRRIIKTGFPNTFRVLCMNCNFGRQRNGGICPHQGHYRTM